MDFTLRWSWPEDLWYDRKRDPVIVAAFHRCELSRLYERVTVSGRLVFRPVCVAFILAGVEDVALEDNSCFIAE